MECIRYLLIDHLMSSRFLLLRRMKISSFDWFFCLDRNLGIFVKFHWEIFLLKFLLSEFVICKLFLRFLIPFLDSIHFIQILFDFIILGVHNLRIPFLEIFDVRWVLFLLGTVFLHLRSLPLIHDNALLLLLLFPELSFNDFIEQSHLNFWTLLQIHNIIDQFLTKFFILSLYFLLPHIFPLLYLHNLDGILAMNVYNSLLFAFPTFCSSSFGSDLSSFLVSFPGFRYSAC